MRRRSGARWFLVLVLALVGAGLGIALTLAAGSVCVDGVSDSFCGLNFLVWNLSSGAALAAAATLGAVIGALVGFVVDFGFARRSSAS